MKRQKKVGIKMNTYKFYQRKIVSPLLYLYLCSMFLLAGLLSYNSFIDIMSKVMMQTTQWGKMKTSLESYVGFDTVQEQIRKKALKRGFELNIMVVGMYYFIIEN